MMTWTCKYLMKLASPTHLFLPIRHKQDFLNNSPVQWKQFTFAHHYKHPEKRQAQ